MPAVLIVLTPSSLLLLASVFSALMRARNLHCLKEPNRKKAVSICAPAAQPACLWREGGNAHNTNLYQHIWHNSGRQIVFREAMTPQHPNMDSHGREGSKLVFLFSPVTRAGQSETSKLFNEELMRERTKHSIAALSQLQRRRPQGSSDSGDEGKPNSVSFFKEPQTKHY